MKHHEIVGLGGERIVYPDPQRPEQRVRKEKRDGQKEPPNSLRAKFYLTKILHLLLPRNIPDIHRTDIRTDMQIVERKRLGEDHALLNEEVRRYEEGEDVSDELRERASQTKQKILGDARVETLTGAFERLGVLVDAAAVNFGEDAEGNMVYVDTFEPWQKRKDGSLKPGFDARALQRALSGLEDAAHRDMGLRWLDRLNEILSEEERRRGLGEKAA